MRKIPNSRFRNASEPSLSRSPPEEALVLDLLIVGDWSETKRETKERPLGKFPFLKKKRNEKTREHQISL
jgi:hypothetical protein